MADVVGVVFQDGNKTYHFDSAGLDLVRGDRVIVQTSKGSEIGKVVDPPHHVEDSELPASLKKVVRMATGEDLEAQASSQRLCKQAMITCRELIAAHGLDMKLVSADISFGGERIIFNFYSDERVDFRGLVGDLARALKMRVELRQIGAREEARMVGGLGPCGRHLCCTLFSGDDDPVSIRMAKEQNLPLNPVKISGLCGRLMCCLKYEQEQYVAFRKEAPPRGTKVVTPTGEGSITGFNVPKEAISVRMDDGSFADLRLSNCERQEDGSLVFAPVEKEESGYTAGELGRSGLGIVPTRGLTAAVDTSDAEALSDGVALSESGTPSDEESKPKRSRRSRRRRSRGQGTEAAGEGDGDSGSAGSRAESKQKRSTSTQVGDKRAGQQSGRPGTQQRKEYTPKQGSADGGGTPSSSGQRYSVPADNGSGEPRTDTERKPRRRRRPRRPGGGGEKSGSSGDGSSGGRPGGAAGGGGGE